MNEYYYMYTKLRKEFGRHCTFDDTETKLVGTVDAAPEFKTKFISSNPQHFVSDNIPMKSEHFVNTERVKTANKGMRHIEGGWPKEVNALEHQDTAKWRKRLDKDPNVADAIRNLCTESSIYLRQNTTIDLYEEYFEDVPSAVNLGECLRMDVVGVFSDPFEEYKRSLSCISWSPEIDKQILAASYSSAKFNPAIDESNCSFFIWDGSRSALPLMELNATSSTTTLQYNYKNSDWILTGHANGLISLYDIKKSGSSPSLTSPIGKSHIEQVTSVFWLQSKQNSEVVSASTDGKMIWWDLRNMKEAMEIFELSEPNKEGVKKTIGITSLDWSLEAGPTKYLMGLENGSCVVLNRKPKKSVEISSKFGVDIGRHLSPVYSVKRNIAHSKYFLSVGDWSAKIFAEDNLKTPIFNTPYYDSALQCSAWSPTRCGLFFLGRRDGFIDTWDLFYKHKECSYSYQISQNALSSISLKGNEGRFLAAGDEVGKLHIVKLNDAYVVPTNNEKNAISAIFERETRREKAVDLQRRLGDTTQKKKDKKKIDSTEIPSDELKQLEADFYKNINA